MKEFNRTSVRRTFYVRIDEELHSLIMHYKQVGHRGFGRARRCWWGFLCDGTGQAACPVDGDGDDEFAES
jgi:hypothetical protein